MADPAHALSETRRVLRPGGRLAVWGAPERNPFLAIIAMTLVERGHMPPPQPGTPSPFSMASEERDAAENAGFSAVRVEQVSVRFPFGDIDEYLSITADTAGPAAIVLRGLSEGEREALKAQLAEGLAPFVVDGGYELPGVSLTAVAS